MRNNKLIFWKITTFFTKRSSLQIFLILFLFVFLIQFSLLNIILKNGFTMEEWLLLFDYKTIGLNANFLDKFLNIFYIKGFYTTYQVIYIGVLESLFKGNYQAYQITNIIFKALATLSLYPLILIVFKRRLLAFLTTVLYAISYSSAGALQFVVKGSDYLAIFFMNVCLIAYYLSFRKKIKFLYITAILLPITFLFSPIRIYPFLSFIVLVEVVIWVRIRGLLGLVTALLRLTLVFSLFLIMVLLLSPTTSGYLNGPLIVYRFLSHGNYQLLLTPFAGLGYTFLTNDYWSFIFGNVTFDSFRNFLFFLLHGPILIYSILAILMGILITKNPLRLILGIISANLLFEIVSYFLITNIRGSVGPDVKVFDPIGTYPIFLGFFCLSIAVSSLILWLRIHRSNILLLVLFIGPIFSSVFLWGTWFIIGDILNFKEGIHWYLIIPPIGSSLFLAGLMVLGFDRIKRIVNSYLKYTLIGFLFLTILPLYLISGKEINTTFTALLKTGYKASDQEQMKSRLLSYIKEPLDKNPALFYFESEEKIFYPVYLVVGFEQTMLFRNWEVVNGCVGIIYDKSVLEKSVAVKDGIEGFQASSLCVSDYFAVERRNVFFRSDNFYAFRLKDKNVVDIKEEVLKNLNF
ncbi:MAG: hypothetical protein PHE48_01920 [Candidatus Daviesbacteria bacterium]|nr:hypothetical protein [Candidatus Daviesbacteria bacterium]